MNVSALNRRSRFYRSGSQNDILAVDGHYLEFGGDVP
jgi:hypothetical protein